MDGFFKNTFKRQGVITAREHEQCNKNSVLFSN
jgi:hypothetical protein